MAQSSTWFSTRLARIVGGELLLLDTIEDGFVVRLVTEPRPLLPPAQKRAPTAAGPT
jgi:hypothetical protein